MSVQFDRMVKVSVGPSGSETAIGVDGLRVSFTVKKTSKRTTNKCTVEIYNISNESYNKISDNSLENILILNAGYAGSSDFEKVLFAGNIVDVHKESKYPDIVTVIECADSIPQINRSISYKAGTTARKILDDIVKLFPVANRNKVEIPNIDDLEYGNGFSDSGKLSDILTQIADALNLEWSVQNNELKIIKKNGDDGTRGILLTNETGLIGLPEKNNDIAISGQKDKKYAGWKVKCLLQPQLEPNGIIEIRSNEITGNTFFKVVSVSHSGDNYGNDWFSESDVIDYEH